MELTTADLIRQGYSKQHAAQWVAERSAPPPPPPDPPARAQARARAETRRQPARAQRNADIRAWAAQAGIEVGQKGRIPESVLLAYERAH